MAAKRILLSEWAAKHYSPPKSDWVLRKMVRDGKIYPPPVKEGREYRVLEDARCLDWPVTLADRLATA